jgi:hypothetical protein
MGRLRARLLKLKRDSRDEQITIPQLDGSVSRFGAGAIEGAFLHEANRLRAIHGGEDPGEPHPLTLAKRNALYLEGSTLDADLQPRKDGQ